MKKRLLHSHIHLKALWVLLIFLRSIGCTEVGRDAYSKALHVERGATEAQLREAAGPPTETIKPAPEHCARAGGSSELVYTVKSGVLGGWVSDAPMYALAFCVDDSSKIVDTTMIDY